MTKNRLYEKCYQRLRSYATMKKMEGMKCCQDKCGEGKPKAILIDF